MQEMTNGARQTMATFAGGRIILNAGLANGYTDEPARKHKRKRIQKKWLKRYGYKPKIDENIYFFDSGMIVMHPATFRKFEAAIGSEEAAAEAIENYFSGGTKP